jgi:hypothetical protein
MILFKQLQTAFAIMKSQGKDIPSELSDIYYNYLELSAEYGNKEFPHQRDVEAYLAGYLYLFLRIPANTIIEDEKEVKTVSEKQIVEPRRKEKPKAQKEPESEPDSDWIKQAEDEALMLLQMQKKNNQ